MSTRARSKKSVWPSSSKDMKTDLDNDMLKTGFKKEEETKERKENYRRREFSFQSFSCSFRLTENCLYDKIDARYPDDNLRVVLPEKEANAHKAPKEIRIS
jgi:HSP20 family protein